MGNLKGSREKIINVAHVVFGKLSLTKTTMDDIARESKMGRRTIYSYFESKEELYKEVVNLQISIIMDKLTAVSASERMAEEKLKVFIRRRMKAVKDICNRNPSVKNDFINNPVQIDKLRKNLDKGEIDLLHEILKEGVLNSEFKLSDPSLTAITIQTSLKAFEQAMLKDNFGTWSRNIIENIIETLLNGIKNE